MVKEGLKEFNRSINEHLIERLRTINKGKPWFGRNIESLLSESSDHPEVLALLRHILAWRKYVIEALNHQRPEIKLNSAADWPETAGLHLENILPEFQNTLDELILGIENFPAEKWHELLWHGEYHYEKLVHGLIDHDLYHIGQVVILSKLKK